jgi:HK97 family phage major capsid protein
MSEQLLKELKEAVSAVRETTDRRYDEMKQFGAESAETKAKIDKLNDSIESMQAKMRELGNSNQNPLEAKSAEEKAFAKYARKGREELTEAERKSLSNDSAPDGGFRVPTVVSAELIRKITELSSVRQLAKNTPLSVSDSIQRTVENTKPTAYWVGEREDLTSSNQKNDAVTIYMKNMGIKVPVTRIHLEDAIYNVEQETSTLAAIAFAEKEGEAFISGDGVLRPKGILSTTSIATVATGSATALTGDDVIKLMYSLKTGYNGVFLGNRETLGYLRYLKAGDDNYLWQAGLALGQPDTILGKGFYEEPNLVAPVAGVYADGNKPLIFGDFARGYEIINKPSMTMVRDAISGDAEVFFKWFFRVGGDVVLPEAFKILRTAVS